jgi:hypothetical protein
MDAEIKSLRIDRSAKQKNRSGRGLLRWILVSFGLSVLLGVAFVIYGWLNAAVEVVCEPLQPCPWAQEPA